MALVLALAGVRPAGAQQPVERIEPAASDGTVKITNPSGSVRVIGWDQDSVAVSGTLGRGAEQLQFTTNERETRIRVVLDREAHEVGVTELEIRVPRNSHVAVRGEAGDIVLDDVWGAADLQSVSGNISVTGFSRGVYAETATGSVVIEADTKILRAKSVDGSVTARGARGFAELSTVSGTIELTGSSLWEGHVTTVSGDIRFRGDFDSGGGFSFESHSGDITLEVPAHMRADVDLVVLGGSVTNDFASPDARSFAVGGGGTQIRIHSFRGDVHIRRR